MLIIAGLYRHRHLKTPKGTQTRPTANRLRETLFNICQQSIQGARFLDIFAGSGAVGLEALSREAESATFIDAHREAIHCIKQNIEQLGVQNQCQVLLGETFAMLKLLEKQNQTFDIIYADPPYCMPVTPPFYSEQVIRWIETHPLLAAGGTLFVEEKARFQPHLEGLQKLKLKKSRQIGESALQQYNQFF